jgi:queuine tRNA-ribosyltransferase
MVFRFSLEATAGNARAGVFETPHGKILTPVFAPVGTQATVKAVLPRDLQVMGASLILANTYHLHLRPGDTLIRDQGGLHHFMAWDGPILTDSGGFQVFSLADLRRINDDGVTFKSHIDGSSYYFTPEYAIEIQHNLGADIVMAFDECAEPDNRDVAEAAMERTHLWAKRCADYHYAQGDPNRQALFGIVQGGIYADLREQSAKTITSLDLPGYAIGGLGIGESKDEMYATLDCTLPHMPADRPRYLMGIGRAEDLVEAVKRGVDIFDCVLPTREARHGAALTRYGRLNMRNLQFAEDSHPIEEGCGCYACTHFSRAYIRHLSKAGEILVHQLLSIHNLYFLLNLMRDMRQAILADEGQFQSFANDFLSDWNS